MLRDLNSNPILSLEFVRIIIFERSNVYRWAGIETVLMHTDEVRIVSSRHNLSSTFLFFMIYAQIDYTTYSTDQ